MPGGEGSKGFRREKKKKKKKKAKQKNHQEGKGGVWNTDSTQKDQFVIPYKGSVERRGGKK